MYLFLPLQRSNLCRDLPIEKSQLAEARTAILLPLAYLEKERRANSGMPEYTYSCVLPWRFLFLVLTIDALLSCSGPGWHREYRSSTYQNVRMRVAALILSVLLVPHPRHHVLIAHALQKKCALQVCMAAAAAKPQRTRAIGCRAVCFPALSPIQIRAAARACDRKRTSDRQKAHW